MFRIMEAKSWIERVTKQAPGTVAKRIGMKTSTMDSQMKSASGLRPETVVKIAREYGFDPLAALVEWELITSQEAGAEVDITESEHLIWLAGVEDDVLLTEIGRRLRERRRNDGDDPGATAQPSGPQPAPTKPGAHLPTLGEVRKQKAQPAVVADRAARPSRRNSDK